MPENKSIPSQPDNEKVSGLPPVRENVPVPAPLPADQEYSTDDAGNGNPPPKDPPVQGPMRQSSTGQAQTTFAGNGNPPPKDKIN